MTPPWPPAPALQPPPATTLPHGAGSEGVLLGGCGGGREGHDRQRASSKASPVSDDGTEAHTLLLETLRLDGLRELVDPPLAPVPMSLLRASSMPGHGSLPPLSLVQHGHTEMELGRRRHRRSPDETLLTAISTFGAQVEALTVAFAGSAAAGNFGGACAEMSGSGGSRGHREEKEIDRSGEQLAQAVRGLEAILSRQWQQQEEAVIAQRELAKEKFSEAQALRELTKAVHKLRAPPTKGSPASSGQSTWRSRPRYTQQPEVRVTVKIYSICNVDTSQMTFETDFVCQLDWEDPNIDGVRPEDLKKLDWEDYFNPYIEVDNCKDGSSWLDGGDTMPHRPASIDAEYWRQRSKDCGSRKHDDIGYGPNLQKIMRFRGTLAIQHVNLRCFPFDVQVLPLRLKAAHRRSFALGTLVGEMGDCGRDGDVAVHLVDVGVSERTSLRPLQDEAEGRLSGRGHWAAPSADEALLEFDICSLTGYHPHRERKDLYEVGILVQRPPFASYFWDIILMNLFVVLAATAFWDTSSADLSSRMSISLTVILTLAAYTSSRPDPIAKAPYVTFHDWMEQMCMFLVTGISIQNVVAVVQCGGQSGDAPPYMQAEFELNPELCAVGWCKSRNVDCRGLTLLVVCWVLLVLYSITWLVRTRRRAMCEALRGADSEPRKSRSDCWLRCWHLLSGACCRRGGCCHGRYERQLAAKQGRQGACGRPSDAWHPRPAVPAVPLSSDTAAPRSAAADVGAGAGLMPDPSPRDRDEDATAAAVSVLQRAATTVVAQTACVSPQRPRPQELACTQDSSDGAADVGHKGARRALPALPALPARPRTALSSTFPPPRPSTAPPVAGPAQCCSGDALVRSGLQHYTIGGIDTPVNREHKPSDMTNCWLENLAVTPTGSPTARPSPKSKGDVPARSFSGYRSYRRLVE